MVNAPSILVVEDDDDVLESIRELLEEAGYRVTAVRNGTQALAALREMPRPAAMLVDLLMDQMTGAELLQACACDRNLAGIPALVMSGGRPDDVVLPSIDGFVSKPFNGEQLLAVLTRVLRR